MTPALVDSVRPLYEPIRQVHGPLVASRCAARPMPRVTNKYARMGLSYQRKVNRALEVTAKAIGAQYEAEPWFQFTDGHGRGQAVPDGLFHFADLTLVIEIKYTFTIDALVKLRGLYLPVVGATTLMRLRPLIICRSLTPDAIPTVLDIRQACALSGAHCPTLLWRGTGPINY